MFVSFMYSFPTSSVVIIPAETNELPFTNGKLPIKRDKIQTKHWQQSHRNERCNGEWKSFSDPKDGHDNHDIGALKYLHNRQERHVFTSDRNIGPFPPQLFTVYLSGVLDEQQGHKSEWDEEDDKSSPKQQYLPHGVHCKEPVCNK